MADDRPLSGNLINTPIDSSIRDSDNFTHVPAYPEMAENYVSFRNAEYQSARAEENVSVYVRIRPPFQSEIDDKVFDPQPNGQSNTDQWQCTFTNEQDP
jgi:hypothetical protein